MRGFESKDNFNHFVKSQSNHSHKGPVSCRDCVSTSVSRTGRCSRSGSGLQGPAPLSDQVGCPKGRSPGAAPLAPFVALKSHELQSNSGCVWLEEEDFGDCASLHVVISYLLYAERGKWHPQRGLVWLFHPQRIWLKVTLNLSEDSNSCSLCRSPGWELLSRPQPCASLRVSSMNKPTMGPWISIQLFHQEYAACQGSSLCAILLLTHASSRDSCLKIIFPR